MIRIIFHLCFWLSTGLFLASCGGGSDSSSPTNSLKIDTQPVSVNAKPGDQVTLFIIASSSAPLTYQWQKNGVDIQGATSATYILSAATFADSSSDYRVLVRSGDSQAASLTVRSLEVKDKSVAPPPIVSLSSTRPLSGESIQLKVTLQGASSITVIPTGDGCGALRTASISGSSLTTTGIVSLSGQCKIDATIVTQAGTFSATNEFTVVPNESKQQGLVFKNGNYFPSGSFETNGINSIGISRMEVPQAIINGGTASIYITPTAATASTTAVFTVTGIPGYYVANGVLESGRLRFDIEISPNFQKDSAASSILSFFARLIGRDGSSSAIATVNTTFQRVGAGSLQVSLSFDQSDDVDLHLVTPDNQDIYYGNRSYRSGGLDLDSNPGCRRDGINNENIVWPTGISLPEGVYKVRVDLFQSCTGVPVNYSVKVVNCGVSNTYRGTFQPAEADRGSAFSGREIASITYSTCGGLGVSGRATYDDYQPLVTGLSSAPRQLPIRNASVEVRSTANDSLLGSSTTDENGDYSVNFQMTTPSKYYVKVLSSQDNETIKQKVVNDSNAIYTIRSTEIDAATTRLATGLNLRAERNGKFAEAFNIFDVGVDAIKTMRARTGVSLPMLTWQWKKGDDICGGGVSCYVSGNTRIHVLSTDADEDSFDDSVLAHEFSHFFMDKQGSERSPGGPHSSASQVSPLLAWSEGAGTFIGQHILNSPQYIDTNSGSSFTINIEDVSSIAPIGTQDGTISGNVSEAVVASILWDLADSASDSLILGGAARKDAISNPTAVFATITAMKSRTGNRGVSGPDLVDFIDAYICLGYGSWEAAETGVFRTLINGLNRFPYIPIDVSTCPR
jgi:hypothetical protein